MEFDMCCILGHKKLTTNLLLGFHGYWPFYYWESFPVMQHFFAVMIHSMWGPFLVLVTKSKSEVHSISLLPKQYHVASLTNKHEVSTNIVESTRVVHILMSPCSHDQLWQKKTNKIRYPYQLIGLVVSVCQWPGRPGFNPKLSHTKNLKNGTWCQLA